MKILLYCALFLAFNIGMNQNHLVANTPNECMLYSNSGGNVGASYDQTTETITLRMISDRDEERVMVVLSGQRGDVIYKEKVIVNNRGITLQIPMEELSSGIYFLRVKGTSLNYSGRFKKN